MLAKTRICSGALWSLLGLALLVALTVHGPRNDYMAKPIDRARLFELITNQAGRAD
jgi:hypothetical protein